MTRRIVVGVDGSESSAMALRWAVEEARLRGEEVDAVFAWLSAYEYYGAIYNTPANHELEKAAQASLDKILAGQGVGDVVVNPVVIEGSPAPVLINASKGADLLVVGARGHGRFVGMLLGSVSQHCVSHAHCPVVVVRDGREDDD